MGADTIYIHLYRTSGPGSGTLYMVDETGTWPSALGATSPLLHLSTLLTSAHAVGIQVVGVVNCFLQGGPLPGNMAHETLLLDVIDHLLQARMANGDLAYPLDGIALDRVRFYDGTNNPAASVNAFIQQVKTRCGILPLHAFIPANLWHIDGPPYNGSFRSYSSAMGLLSGQYGHDWPTLTGLLDVFLPMAYVADGGLYGNNHSLMQSYLHKVSSFVRTAELNAGGSGLRVAPAIRAWNDTSGTTSAASLTACATGSLTGGGDGFMSFRWGTSLGQPTWWNALAALSAPGSDLPLPDLQVLSNQGLTVTLDASGSQSLHGPLLYRFDLDDDGVADTPFGASSTIQFLVPTSGPRIIGVEVQDSLGRRAGRRKNLILGNGSLSQSVGFVQLSVGGTVGLTIDAGPAGAGLAYAMAASMSGTTPGLQLTPDLIVPLNPDPWFDFTLTYANANFLPGFQGVLDSNGLATAQMLIPPGVLPSQLAYQTIHYAGAGFDPVLSEFRFVTGPVSVALFP